MPSGSLRAVAAPQGAGYRNAVGTLRWCHLGRVDYDAARALQSRLASDRAAGGCGDTLLLLEHPPVVTTGRNAPLPAATSLPVVRTDRGGKVTYHGPGQLVAYPVLALRAAGRGVRTFVAQLEQALCDTAAHFGVAAYAHPGLPGIWTAADTKLASIGLAVRRGVTLHGSALNVTAAAESGFAGLDPCGLPGVRMTSLVGAGARPDLTTDDVAPVLAALLARRLDLVEEHITVADLAPASFFPPAVAVTPASSSECHGHQRAS
jgi:lipoyl(octanoyl) transferase